MESRCDKRLDGRGTHSLKVVSHNGKTHIFLDGENVSDKCTKYILSQCGGQDTAQLELQFIVQCQDVDVSVDTLHIEK